MSWYSSVHSLEFSAVLVGNIAYVLWVHLAEAKELAFRAVADGGRHCVAYFLPLLMVGPCLMDGF